jgi:hypothetical protein
MLKKMCIPCHNYIIGSSGLLILTHSKTALIQFDFSPLSLITSSHIQYYYFHFHYFHFPSYKKNREDKETLQLAVFTVP